MRSDGAVLTAAHVISGFIKQWSPHTLRELDQRARTGTAQSAPVQEVPHISVPREGWSRLTKVGQVTPLAGFAVEAVSGDHESDIATLWLGADALDSGILNPASVATSPPEIGDLVELSGMTRGSSDEVDALGFPATYRYERATAKIAATIDNLLVLDREIESGFSGGPVVLKATQEVVGILVESWPAKLSSRLVGLNRRLSAASSVIGWEPPRRPGPAT